MANETKKESMSPKETIRQARIQKLTDLADKGINPYPYSYDRTAVAQDLQDKYLRLSQDEVEPYSGLH